jgi:hypothetical protein
LDCLDSALCCFDGCANVCQGKGAKAGNGLVPEKKGPAELPVLASSPLLQPLIKSPTKANLQTVPKPKKQDQLQPQIQPRPDIQPQSQIQPHTTIQYNPQISSNSQAELDAALGDLAKVLVAESRPRPSPVDDRIVYPEPLANNRYPRRPAPVANPSPSYEQLLVVADQKAAQKDIQRPNYAGQPLIKKPESTQIPSEKATHGFGYGGQPIIRKPAAQFVESNDPGPKQFVEAIQPPNPQNTPKLQSQFQTSVQQPTYEPQPQFDFISSQAGSQPSRTRPLVEVPAPVQSDQGAASLPFTQCPSAMKCVEKKLCDFNGVMRDFVTTLSPAQETLRVPLIPCVSQRAIGKVDVCCRDPNYKDPWPEQEQAREESRSLGGDKWRWSKDVRSRENAARSRSKAAANNLPPQVAANQQLPQVAAYDQQLPQVAAYDQQLPQVAAYNQQLAQAAAYDQQLPQVAAYDQQLPASQVAQLPSRIAANQPTSIFEENVQEFSSSPTTEEVRKPKRRIAYG